MMDGAVIYYFQKLPSFAGFFFPADVVDLSGK
jgi:hypothetical protein